METPLSYIQRRLVWYATCSVSTEHTEQQSNRATEHSAGHVTQRSAVLAAGRDERRRLSDPLPEASLQCHYIHRDILLGVLDRFVGLNEKLRSIQLSLICALLVAAI